MGRKVSGEKKIKGERRCRLREEWRRNNRTKRKGNEAIEGRGPRELKTRTLFKELKQISQNLGQ